MDGSFNLLPCFAAKVILFSASYILLVHRPVSSVESTSYIWHTSSIFLSAARNFCRVFVAKRLIEAFISDHVNMSRGNVIVYFPKSHDLSNIPFNLLEEDLGFKDDAPETGNIGSIDYGNNDLWKAVVVRGC